MNPAASDRADPVLELRRRGYAIERHLADGSTAEVLQARQVDTNRQVALKISRADIPEAPLIVSRMLTEWNVGRGLLHPHLVSILDGGQLTDGRAWLAMELLRGHDLEVELREHGRLPPVRAIHIIRQVCEALGVLHRRGAVHRDVKPENIFLTADGRFTDHVKVVDLGILALPEDDKDRAHEPTGMYILGTPLYLAPEQARGEPPDARTDVYALGGVLFHMLAGRPPFEDDVPAEVVARHVNEAPPRLDRLVPGLPRALVTLVHRCLEKERARRPASTEEIIGVLDQIGRALAGPIARDATPTHAPLPGVPLPGRVGDWLLFGENLGQLVERLLNPAPPPVVQAMGRLRQARAKVDAAQAAAAQARQTADSSARERIAARERLQRRVRSLRENLTRATGRHAEATAALDGLTAEARRNEQRYARVLDALRAQTRPTVAETKVALLDHHRRRVEHVLREREALMAQLKEARLEERDAAEQLAAARGRIAELEADLAETELEEQEEGVRDEQRAGLTSDALDAAVHGLEEAALQLMLRYAQALQAPEDAG